MVVNPYFTLSKADSVISGQALRAWLCTRGPSAHGLVPWRGRGSPISTSPFSEARDFAVHREPRQSVVTKNLPPRLCHSRIIKRPDIQNNSRAVSLSPRRRADGAASLAQDSPLAIAAPDSAKLQQRLRPGSPGMTGSLRARRSHGRCLESAAAGICGLRVRKFLS